MHIFHCKTTLGTKQRVMTHFRYVINVTRLEIAREVH